MAKRPKWLGPPNHFWAHGSKFAHKDPWVWAIAAIDNLGDNQPLIRMLLSDAELDAKNRHYLADLLQRKQLKDMGGYPPTPAYKKTEAEDVLADAVAAVKGLVKVGKPVPDALEEVENSTGIPYDTLKSAYDGTRQSTRRMAKRKPKTITPRG